MTEPGAKRAHFSTTLQASHPNGIQPCGNSYTDVESLRSAHLGNFSMLSDEVLIDILSGVAARDLLTLAQCSRWLYCFVNHDDVWRQKLLSVAAETGFDYVGTWKDTYLRRSRRGAIASPASPAHLPPLRFSSVFSDYLFEPWVAHSLNIDPSWLQSESVARCPADMDVREFIAQYDEKRTPAVLTGYTQQWPAYKRWSPAYLMASYPEARLNAGAASLTFEQYFAYASHQQDERPLYVFDKQFVSKCPPMEQDYR